MSRLICTIFFKCIVSIYFFTNIVNGVSIKITKPKNILPTHDGKYIVPNGEMVIEIRCNSPSNPTKWIFNEDLESVNTKKGRTTYQWSEKLLRQGTIKLNTIANGTYTYTAGIRLVYTANGLIEAEILVCSNIHNLMDNKTVLLKTVDTNVEIITTLSPEEALVVQNANAKKTVYEMSSCALHLSVLDFGLEGTYWHCMDNNGNDGNIRFFNCGWFTSTMGCENLFREIKNPKCVNIVDCVNLREKEDLCEQNNVFSNHENSSIVKWIKMNESSSNADDIGVVLCTSEQEIRLAQNYFISKNIYKVNQTLTIPYNQTLHLSWEKVNPIEEIKWLESFKDIYYKNENFSMSCQIPKFGLSKYAYIVVAYENDQNIPSSINRSGSSVTTPSIALIHENLQSIGNYSVYCVAHEWDTTKWVNKMRVITVIEPTSPNFEQDYENITFTEGDSKRTLICSAFGDPQPNVEWKISAKPNIRKNGAELHFTNVDQTMKGIYSCEAVNQFGQYAWKEFKVTVIKSENESKTSSEHYSIGLILTICIGIAVGILVIVGCSTFYFKLQSMEDKLTYLTNEEVKEFREGIERYTIPHEGIPLNDVPKIDALPYNPNYEVSKDKIFVDRNSILGSGAYGIVMKGTITLDSHVIPVAFKTIKPNVDIIYFKALLSELKILVFVGRHENIVNLIGAFTGNIQNRELLIGVELCQISLLGYLQENACYFQKVTPPDDLAKESAQSDYQNYTSKMFSTNELIRWSKEIATGMEFISFKNVIHGDLAGRNILLTFDLQAKICDFGLARQLVDYNYTKSEQCPLPWKWMALESLSQMKFSTASDVWAYGVTLWEIFSLGYIPYPGITWSMDFVSKLESGLRMSCPNHGNDVVYDIMLKCWDKDPKGRPNFTQILAYLEEVEPEGLSTTKSRKH